MFRMIEKSGDLSQPGNYRPIAILSIYYKIFSRMLYDRIQPQLDDQQAHEQCGFRPGIRIEDAIVTVENLISATNEFNIPLWIASLDLRKAFDRIQHSFLFEALREQGLSDAEVALILDMYTEQTGTVDGNVEFPIYRGVKQGDTLSSILFNAALEHMFRKWKQRLDSQGWQIQNHLPRLTHVRFADDILLFAKSLDEIIMMLEFLKEELAEAGLEMHPDKTKIMTSDGENTVNVIDIHGMMIWILKEDAAHRYLGRLLNLHSKRRVKIELDNRFKSAWAAFHKHRKWLVNQYVPVGLRLRLFDAVVSPSVLFALSVLPVGKCDLQQLQVLQRRMLRLIVGWRRIDGEDWAITMHRMKKRISDALSHHKIDDWQDKMLRHRWKFAIHVVQNSKMKWPYELSRWIPARDVSAEYQPHRLRGRPALRWDDQLHECCGEHVGLLIKLKLNVSIGNSYWDSKIGS